MANVAAPANWDQSKSGVVLDPYAGLGPYPELTGGTLPQIDDTLAGRWDGTKYVFPTTYEDPLNPGSFLPTEGPFRILLVSPVLFELPDLYVDMIASDSSYPAITVFDSAGEAFPGVSYLSAASNVAVPGEPGRYVWRFMRDMGWDPELAETVYAPLNLTAVKAILISGVNDYPQGRVVRLYGVDGLAESADVPFWTDFTGEFYNNINTRKRMTELF